MKLFQFSKPKNPGFGLSADFYLTVLSSKAPLPSILELVNPATANGAVEGFGAPLASGADKASLSLPLERGVWVVASKDRKTVLRLRVLSKEEAGFDPEAFLRSAKSAGIADDVAARLRATWSLLQFTFESHDAMVYPALDFLLDVAERAANLTDGLVADPICARYLLPEAVRHRPPVDSRVDARDHVTVGARVADGSIAAHTAGLRKFSLPELEIDGLDESDLTSATTFLLATAQAILLGQRLEPGSRFGKFTAQPIEPADSARDGVATMRLSSASGNRAALD